MWEMLVMSRRNILLMFVFTLTLKPLILSLLLYNNKLKISGFNVNVSSLIKVFFNTRYIRYSPADHRWYLFGNSWWVQLLI